MPKTSNTLKDRLKARLKGASRIAVLGVGSELRGDDSAGMLAAKSLDEWRAKGVSDGGLAVFFGGSAPENITGEIKRFAPTHLIIIDALDAAEAPGAVTLIDSREIGGASFSTHRLPLEMVIEYLRNSIGCEIIIIGIKPKGIGLGETVSGEVAEAAEYVSEVIKGIYGKR